MELLYNFHFDQFKIHAQLCVRLCNFFSACVRSTEREFSKMAKLKVVVRGTPFLTIPNSWFEGVG
jgi:hypothetical protein